MKDYIKQLEDQNEELRQKLAEATDQRYTMEWNSCNVEDYNDHYKWIYEMRVHGMLFAIILELKKPSFKHKRYLTRFKNINETTDNHDTLVQCKAHIFKTYTSMFMDEPNI